MLCADTKESVSFDATAAWLSRATRQRALPATCCTALPGSISYHRFIHLAAQTPITFWQRVYGIFVFKQHNPFYSNMLERFSLYSP